MECGFNAKMAYGNTLTHSPTREKSRLAPIKVMGKAILIIIIIIKIIIMHIFGRIKFRYSTLDTVP